MDVYGISIIPAKLFNKLTPADIKSVTCIHNFNI